MKKKIIIFICLLAVLFLDYYFILPVINIHALEFWMHIVFWSFVIGVISIFTSKSENYIITKNKFTIRKFTLLPKVCFIISFGIIILILLVNFICCPLFNAKSYSKRITITESENFTEDIKEVDFNSLPLLDRDSSEKLGDRVMGKMSDLVSQYYVSNQYTQINYNNDIIRVTPLEYADFIKWISNRKEGVKGYITVDSVTGNSKLVKLDKGMKYMSSGFFNDNLKRKLRFSYPTTVFGDAKFEIDNEGNPYFIVPTLSYTAVGLKTKVSGVIIFDPITGKSKKYKMEDVPTWVDNAYSASLVIEQVDDWGNYKRGFINSIFGQKGVVNTTDGYNYLAMDDDIYLYTGITSVLADESNLGFILSNMRTGKTMFYSVAGAEEYSAMNSAQGQVQQMNYVSTFPLLINLNNKPTYLVSLKDQAGLVKMYGFIDVEDYQKVAVTDVKDGIKAAAQNYLNSFGEKEANDLLKKETITVKKITSAVISGTTNYYIVDTNNKKYKVSIKVSSNLAFIDEGDKLDIGYFDNNDDIIEIKEIF